MVAYSFKAQFAEPIAAGVKRQTLRNDRKRHARPGEELQLYSGMRTRSCRLLGRATCLTVEPIRLVFFGGWIEFPATGELITQLDRLTAFCRADGFEHWNALRAFWAKEHGDVDEWEGVRITWGDSFRVDPA